MIKLYNYFRSSASYRVRIGLNYKQIPYEYISVHLVKNGGEQNQAAYLSINPMAHVPALDHNGFVIAESMAILDYLDQVTPEHPLFPKKPHDRARVMQICEVINSGIQPLQNLKVLQYLEKDLGHAKPESDKWVQHWVEKGFASLEKILVNTSGSYCFGGEFTAADCFLLPQCFAARRFGVQIEKFPHISRVETNGLKLPAVQAAHPEKQPDYSA